jgi:hypothetical protein
MGFLSKRIAQAQTSSSNNSQSFAINANENAYIVDQQAAIEQAYWAVMSNEYSTPAQRQAAKAEYIRATDDMKRIAKGKR